MPKRDLSCFHCKELLYEFSVGLLDERRRTAVQGHLSDCDRCSEELQVITKGLKYSEKLSKTSISSELSAFLTLETTFLTRMAQSLRAQRWTTSVRWAAESLAVAGIVAISVSFLAQKYYFGSDKSIDERELLAEMQNTEHVADDEQGEEGVEGPEGEERVAKNDEGEILVEEGVEGEGVPSAVVTKTGASPVPTAAAVAVAPTPQATSASAEQAQTTGYVYLGVMYTDYLDQVTPEIAAKVLALGGKKAGKVDLGWRKKGSNESYFHFTLPEAKMVELITFLKSHSPLKVDKQTHPRVMPRGQIRFILQVRLPVQESAPGAIQEGMPEGVPPPTGDEPKLVPPIEGEGAGQ